MRTIKDLVRLCVTDRDQWHHHFLTTCDGVGRVRLGIDCGTKFVPDFLWHRWMPLDGYVTAPRSEWFAIRPEYDEGMTLYRLDQGESKLIEVAITSTIYNSFRFLFEEGGGMKLRPSEEKQQEAEANELEQARRDAIASR
jgi:hypothetical protein